MKKKTVIYLADDLAVWLGLILLHARRFKTEADTSIEYIEKRKSKPIQFPNTPLFVMGECLTDKQKKEFNARDPKKLPGKVTFYGDPNENQSVAKQVFDYLRNAGYVKANEKAPPVLKYVDSVSRGLPVTPNANAICAALEKLPRTREAWEPVVTMTERGLFELAEKVQMDEIVARAEAEKKKAEKAQAARAAQSAAPLPPRPQGEPDDNGKEAAKANRQDVSEAAVAKS